MKTSFKLLLAGGALLASPAGSAKDCAPGNLPPGVRVPERPGCKAKQAAAGVQGRLKQGRNPGFVDLGNGTEVRISGRTRIQLDTGR